MGSEPKDEKKAFLVRVPESLLDEVKGWADQEMRSLNGQIEWILREALRRRHGEPGSPQGSRGRRTT